MWTLSCSMHVGSSSLTRGSNPCPLPWRWILNHCTTREVPRLVSFCILPICVFIYKLRVFLWYKRDSWVLLFHSIWYIFLLDEVSRPFIFNMITDMVLFQSTNLLFIFYFPPPMCSLFPFFSLHLSWHWVFFKIILCFEQN